MSWLQAQINAQLHKDGTKETPNGCKPPPRIPPQPRQSSRVPDTAQLGTGWGGGHNPLWRVKGTAVPQASC